MINFDAVDFFSVNLKKWQVYFDAQCNGENWLLQQFVW